MIEELKASLAKVSISALLALVSHVTLSEVASFVAIIYTLMQIYNLFLVWKKEKKN